MKKIIKYNILFSIMLPLIVFFLNLLFVKNIDDIWFVLILISSYLNIIFCFLYINKEKNNVNILKNKELIFMIIYTILVIITTFLSSNLSMSIFGEEYRHDGLITFMAYIGFFLSSTIIDKKDFKDIINIMIIVSTFLSFISILNYFLNLQMNFNYFWFSSVFYNPNHFGYYLVLVLLYNVYAILKNNNKFFYISFIINLICLIYNNTFGSYLGYASAIIILLIYCLYNKKYIKKVIFIMVITLALSLTIVNKDSQIIVLNNFSALTNDITKINNTKDEEEMLHIGNRYGLWTTGIKIFLDRSITGYGLDNLKESYALYNIDEDRPHNEYLQILLTSGIFSLISYLLFLIFLIKNNIKKKNNLMLIILIGYLVSAFFGNTMYYTTIYFYMLLGFIENDKLFD